MDLEIRHLRLVAEISAAGSMTKAAGRLYLTQSALSHQLRDLEARFETPFFLRLGKRMVLTPAGERLLQSARRVLDDLGRAEEDLKRLAGHGEGIIRVCTQCNTGYHWLAPLLAAFQRRHPGVSVNIVADATERPLDALFDGRLDVAILTADATDRRLRLRPLFLDEMVVIAAPSHPLARRGWISPRELVAEHLLLYASAPEESFLLRRVLAPAGLAARRVSFIMLTEAMIEMAKAGVGLGVLPRWSAHAAIASGAVAPLSITRKGVHRQWTAATLKAQPEPPYLTHFLDLVTERALPARRKSA